jgi:NAD(P)-dependent dehydrogenase (short-subunit alcohol dehydrogenase family)
VVFDDINFKVRPYDPLIAYGQSKTANVLFAVEATRRWAGDGITANAVHPGTITSTNLMRYIPPEVLADLRTSLMNTYKGGVEYKTIEQGAATTVLVATSPRLEGVGGRYFEECNEAAVVDPGTPGAFGVAAYALDPEAAARLWRISTGALSGDEFRDSRGV